MEFDLEKLKAPFDESDIEWRITRSGKSSAGVWARAVPYIQARAVYDRLDAVVGSQNWQSDFRIFDNGAISRIGIRFPAGWVWKSQGAAPSDIESFKGMLSNAEKRAGSSWGIGRYLYDVDEVMVKCGTERREGWNWAKTKDNTEYYWETPKLPQKKDKAMGRPGPAPTPATSPGQKDCGHQAPSPSPAKAVGSPAAKDPAGEGGVPADPVTEPDKYFSPTKCRDCQAEVEDRLEYCPGCRTRLPELSLKISKVEKVSKPGAAWIRWVIVGKDGFGIDVQLSTFNVAAAELARKLIGPDFVQVKYEVSGDRGQFKNFIWGRA